MPFLSNRACIAIIACTLPSLAPAADALPPVPAAAPAAEAPAPSVPTTAECAAVVDGTTIGTSTLDPKTVPAKDRRWYLPLDPEQFSMVEATRGFSFDKPMYLLPATWAEPYHGRSTEVLFSISFKLRPSGWPLYVAYSQKSFFQAYNSKDSKPFRESDFNPEIFWRLDPETAARWFHLTTHVGADLGIEHESNGLSLPESRSWNRAYLAPYWRGDDTLVYWKWWYRFPEDKSRPRTDPNRDDNPDIQDYYGYSELHVEQKLFGSKHLAHLMLRYNPSRGRGAANLQYSIPVLDSGEGPRFYVQAYVWQGYGESMLDYNRSITRVGLGISVAR